LPPLIGLNMSLRSAADGSDELYLPWDYGRALEEAGALAVCVPPSTGEEGVREVIALLDGFLFTGGLDYRPEHYGGRPQSEDELMDVRRDRFDLALARMILDETDLPVLGVCGGCQLINIARGGTLIQDIATDVKAAEGRPLPHARAQRPDREAYLYRHPVRIAPRSLLAAVLEAADPVVPVNSFHHQAVHPDGLGRGLIPSAWSADGIIEAIEAEDAAAGGRFILGVQWHPERMRDEPLQRSLFRSFAAAARRRRPTA